MQNYCKTIGALAAASALVAGNAMAEVEYELQTGYASEYLYRGVTLGNDLVEVSADVRTEYNGLQLSAGAWYGMFEGAPEYNMTETDLYADVSKDFGPVTASIGYIYRTYDFDGWYDNDQDTQEVYFGLSHDFGWAQASLTYYWGVDGVKNLDWFADNVGFTDGYTELALTRTFVINPCLGVNVGTNLGYLMEGDEFTAWTTKVALDWAFAEHATFSPFVALSIALGESDVPSLWMDTENELVGGAKLSVKF